MIRTWTRHLVLVVAVALQACTVLPAAHADEFDTLRTKWQTRLTGGTAVNLGDADVAAQVATVGSNGQSNWSSMDKTASRTALWSDLSTWTASTSITTSYVRLSTMAAAYATTGSTLYHNAALAADIVAALDWLNTNYYNASIAASYDNWWDWQIGTPQALNNVMVNIYDQLSAAQIASYVAAIDRFAPDPTWRTNTDGTLSTTAETGANRLDKALVVVMRGIVGKSSAKIAAGRDAISQALLYVTTGDGFYVDGSFIQHTHVPYVGSYGAVAMADMAQLFYILTGSTWAVTDTNAANVYTWAVQAFAPFIYDGAMMDSTRGRAISRQYYNDHVTGRGVIASLALLSQGLGTDQAAQLRALAKGWMQRDTTFGDSYFTATPTAVTGVYSGVALYELGLMKSILADADVTASAEPVQAAVYASMDRALSRVAGSAFGVSMFSPRISAFEYGNLENIKGWWTGMGMTSLYNADLTQFSDGYWPTIDSTRLPGTTTDHSGSGTPVAWRHYGNTRNNVGGASLGGAYAVLGMDFATLNATGSALSGKKAWFLFGDRIVAVGAGIVSTDGASVETIAENRKLDDAGDNALTVNGVAKSVSAGWSEAMTAVQWAHLAGSVAGADIGYYFPDAPTVNGLRETRSGAWSDINGASGSTTSVSNSYLSLALAHGANPTAGVYSYVLLPGRTAAQTASYVASPTVSVIERSTTATAVRDTALGLVGVMFWADASKTVTISGQPYVISDKKAALLTQQVGNDLQVSVADPTQANTGVINIEINRSAASLISADTGITITQLSPTIKFSVSVASAAGKSFHAHFNLNSITTLYPSDDAYVRDGAYASTNYGKTTTMVVKYDATSYLRKGLMKFDLSSITGTISSAKLTLTATSVGQTTAMTHNMYTTTTDSWLEAAVTYATMPANSALATSWTVPAAGSSVTVDLTSQAATALAGDKLLSLELEAAANYGSGGSVEYASKDHATPALRPILVITTN